MSDNNAFTLVEDAYLIAKIRMGCSYKRVCEDYPERFYVRTESALRAVHSRLNNDFEERKAEAEKLIAWNGGEEILVRRVESGCGQQSHTATGRQPRSLARSGSPA